MKLRSITAMLIAVLILCAGCRRREPVVQNWTVVSQISVTSELGDSLTRQIYNDSDKMRRILNALRQLGQKSTPEVDPDRLPLRSFSITLTHTDGSQQTYCTKGDRYIRQDPGPWQEADPKMVEELNLLLQTLPGDEP